MMAYTVREFIDILNSLPEDIKDYQIDICKDGGDYNEETGEYDNPFYDPVYQLQIKKRDFPFNNVVIIHGDYTCHCNFDCGCIFPIVDEDNNPVGDL